MIVVKYECIDCVVYNTMYQKWHVDIHVLAVAWAGCMM